MSALLEVDFVSVGSLWTIVWQSTAWLVAGLTLSAVWRRRPARAHLTLVTCLVAALISPLLTIAVGALQWGLLPARERAALTAPDVSPPLAEGPAPGAAESAAPSADAVDVAPAVAEVHPRPARAPHSQVAPAGTASEHWPTWSAICRSGFGIWSAVALILAARLAQNLIAAVLLVRKAAPVRDAALHECLRRATERLGVAPPRLASSAACRCPMIWCWGRPVLFVPPDANAQAPLAWEAIFAHELAHLLRRDHLSDLCGELTVILLPWHPLTWLTRARMHMLAEEACDDWAVTACSNAIDYAESLLALVPQERTAALAAVTIRSSLGGRVKRLLVERVVVPGAGWRFAAIVFALGLMAVAGAALGQRSPAVAAPTPTGSPEQRDAMISQEQGMLQLKGMVVDESGQPLPGANVSLLGREFRRRAGGNLPTSFREGDDRSLRETVTDGTGRFELALNDTSPEQREWLYLIARSPGKGLAWRRLSSDPLPEEIRVELAADSGPPYR